MKCKNCGHELTSGWENKYYHKDSRNHRKICSCVNPEPEKKEAKK